MSRKPKSKAAARASSVAPARKQNEAANINAAASGGRRGWLFGLGLMAATLLVYWPALHGDFIFDDTFHISDDPPVVSPNGLIDIWTKAGATPQYYPLTFSLFWLGFRLWGLHTFGYHLVNVLLHGTAAILFWQILKKLRVPGAWLAGAIFALHPVCVMSVAWMTELKNVLSATLALGATWVYLRAMGLGTYGEAKFSAARKGAEELPRLNPRFYALSLGLFLLAMLSKTAVSFLPVTLLLLAWWCGRRLNWRTVWPVLPMLGIVLGLGIVTVYVEGHSGGASGEKFNLPLPDRVLVSGRSFWFYLERALLPRLSPFLYEHWDVNVGAAWQYFFPLATIGALFAAWRWRARFGRGVFAALLHYFVTTSFLIILVVPYFTVFSYVSDHWQYFGLLGLVALAAAGIMWALQTLTRGNTPVELAVCGALLAYLGALTFFQSGMYVNGETLWTTTLARNPNCAQAHNRYGDILFQRGDAADSERALAEFQKAVELAPKDPEARYNLGNALARKGRMDDAQAQFQKTLELAPDSGLGYNGLGKVYSATQKYDEAIAQFQQAVKARPKFIEAHLNLGNALLKAGRADEAIAEFTRTVEIDPTNFAAHLNLGTLLAKKDQLDAAIVQFRQAQTLSPGDPMASTDLGTALMQKGQVDAAVVEFTRAAQNAPNNYGAHLNLGLLLYQQRHLDEAIAQFKLAFELRPDLPDARDRLNRIAWMLATSPAAALRNGAVSLSIAQELVGQAGGNDPTLLATLAAAYAETGKLAEAVTTATQAHDLAARQGRSADILEPLAAQLENYRAGQPFRDTNLGSGNPPPAQRQ